MFILFDSHLFYKCLCRSCWRSWGFSSEQISPPHPVPPSLPPGGSFDLSSCPGDEAVENACPVPFLWGLVNPVLLGPSTGLAQSGHPRDVCPVNHWVSTELSTTPQPGYCTGRSAGVLAPIKTEVRSCHPCGTEGKPRSLQWPWKPTVSGVLLGLSPHPCLCSKICPLLVLSLTARLPPRTCHRRLPWTHVGTGSTLSPPWVFLSCGCHGESAPAALVRNRNPASWHAWFPVPALFSGTYLLKHRRTGLGGLAGFESYCCLRTVKGHQDKDFCVIHCSICSTQKSAC